MDILKNLFYTIFNSAPLSAILLMSLIVAFFGYLALTAKIVKDKK